MRSLFLDRFYSVVDLIETISRRLVLGTSRSTINYMDALGFKPRTPRFNTSVGSQFPGETRAMQLPKILQVPQIDMYLVRGRSPRRGTKFVVVCSSNPSTSSSKIWLA